MSTKPTDAPDWATDANHPASGDEWGSQPNKVKPSDGQVGSGINPNEDFFAEIFNWIANNHGEWIKYLTSSMNANSLGDGSDGDLHFDGTSTVAGLVPSTNVYTLTRNLYADQTLLIDNGVTVQSNGYKVYCRGRVRVDMIAGGFSVAGVDASGATAGIAGHAGTIPGGTAGGNGATGAGAAGSAVSGYSVGARGGSGGAHSGNAGGASGASSVPVGTNAAGFHDFSGHTFGYLVGLVSGVPSLLAYFGGTGGGGGGGDSGSQVGGGGGGGGGVLIIVCRELSLVTAAALLANGGHGGTAAIGGGGGGGGGGGVLIACESVDTDDASSLTGAVCCAGGVGGSGGSTNGSNGSDGTVNVFPLVDAGNAPTAAVAHEERGFHSVTAGTGSNHEYVDVTLALPFASATGASGYEVKVQISLTTDGEPVIIPNITNKTASGFRIRFSSDFDGEVRWSAK